MLLIQPGQIINDTYRIDRLLGSGGMADVYVVTHCRMPRQFALKVMRAASDSPASFLDRFKREAEILARLRHPHIVDVIDNDIMADGRPFLVMDLLEGEDLNMFLAQKRMLPLPLALHLCHQIGDALSAAHSVGITHRDLKPSNIFLCSRGPFPNFVRILDFGIAKVSAQACDTIAAKTHTAIVGTPGYMAPEQVYGRTDKLGPAADQFALAAILYEMLTGRPAFFTAQDSVYAIMARTVTDDPPELELGLPQLKEAIKRAMSKEPEDRFPTMRHFLAAVGATSLTVFQELPVSMYLPPPSTLGERQGEVIKKLSRRRMLRSAGLAAIFTFAASMGVVAMMPKAKQDPLDSSRAEFHLTASADSTNQLEATPAQEEFEKKNFAGSRSQANPLLPEPQNAAPVLITLAPKAEGDVPVDNSAATLPSLPTKPTAPAIKVSPRKPSASGPRNYVIAGVESDAHVRVLQTCLHSTLNGVSGLDGGVIKLERSGSLQIVDAPAAVRRTSLDACLQQAFVDIPVKQLPQMVVIRIVRGG